MTDLIEFLRDRLDHDWACAAGIFGVDPDRLVRWLRSYPMPDGTNLIVVDGRVVGALEPVYAIHVARFDGWRMLREIKAKRKFLDEVEAQFGRTGYADDEITVYLKTVVLPSMALPYSDHPDYRAEEWAP